MVTTVIAYSSRKTSTTLPPVVNGFEICDETVSSWQLTQKRLSPMVEISVPFALCSNMYMSTVPIASTTSVAIPITTMRPRRSR